MTNQRDPTAAGGARDILVLAVAVAVLVLFGLLSVYLLLERDMPEPEWTRAVFVVAGIEALAYAAAGFLFGREVHRQWAERAESRAARAEARAVEAETRTLEAEKRGAEAAACGRSLAAAVHAKASRARQGTAATPADLLELDDLATRSYP